MMTIKKKLTIAIPTYNRCDILKQTLDQLIAYDIQNLPSVEIMVRDNASVDNTFDLLTDYHWKHGIIISRNARNYGFSENYCGLLRSCSSDYLLIISDEDPVLKSGLDLLLILLDHFDFAFATTAFYIDGKIYRGQTHQVEKIGVESASASSFYISGLIYNRLVLNEVMPRVEKYIFHPRCIYPQIYLATVILALYNSYSLPFPVSEKANQAPGSNFGEYWKPDARRDQAEFYLEFLKHLIETSADETELAKYVAHMARTYPVSLSATLEPRDA